MSLPNAWALRFPSESSGAAGQETPVMQLPHDLIRSLGIEEMATYLRVAMWNQLGQSANIARLAEELWSGDRYKAGMWIAELRTRGLIATQAAFDADYAAAVADVEMMPPRPVQAPAEWGPGHWTGAWPVGAVCPGPTVPVVYYAYDHDGLSYVGSTGDFRKRMGDHLEHRRSIGWTTWVARECSTRRAAYTLELSEIGRLNPPQNATKGADYVKAVSR